MLSATAMGEFMKLPALVRHWQHHQQQHDSAGLFNFLVVHYTQENGTDEDAAEDSQLPFKSTDAAASATWFSVAPPRGMEVNGETPWVPVRLFGNLSDPAIPNPFAENIWQPPRLS